MRLKHNKYMKESLEPRDFQFKGVYNFLKKKKGVLALPTGCGKSLTSLLVYTYAKTKNPKMKLVFVTEKTAVEQMYDEVYKFFNTLKADYMYEESKASRQKIREDFLANYDILITNYAPIRNDYEYWADLINRYGGENLMFIFDEATALKNRTSKISKIAQNISKNVARCLGLTATPSKGALHDIYNILYSLGQKPCTVKYFDENFCDYSLSANANIYFRGKVISKSVGYETTKINKKGVEQTYWNYKFSIKSEDLNFKNLKITKMSRKGSIEQIGHNSFQYSVIESQSFGKDFFTLEYTLDGKPGKDTFMVYMFDDESLSGYKNISEFKKLIEPYIYAVPKSIADKELPQFTVCRWRVDHDKVTNETLGRLYMNEGTTNFAQINIALSTPQSLNTVVDTKIDKYYQNSKIKELVRLLKNDLQDEKVIIYSHSKSVVKNVNEILYKELGYRPLTIHGDIEDRDAVKKAFYSTGAENRILTITDAAIKAINLQVAGHIIVLNFPMNAGDFLQLAGRISRIGTEFKHLVMHFITTYDSADEDWHDCIYSQLVFLNNITPEAMEKGLLTLQDIEKYKPLKENEVEVYMRKKLENRKSQYLKHVSKLEL